MGLLPEDSLLLSCNILHQKLLVPIPLKIIQLVALVRHLAHNLKSLRALPKRLLLELQNDLSVELLALDHNLPEDFHSSLAEEYIGK